ncbi:bridging integrator 2a [Corythoichthys intestinalis]|uniref:bridging integrator 2a n=1 Tax=Corythoichthys intestinalis TaxID=161448 RepID=UPI0025A60094|nr:bridging integrator 2a [Corythoichthys intestinalis]XP_061803519.1 bridging integrator 2-like [Nerophis lumbriciformis]
MADRTSPKGSTGDFAKKVQRRLSRGKEKVLQKLGKSEETRDDQFELFAQQFNDQQIDGNRIYKDLRNYIEAVRDMREASRRLSQSLFDVYESDWVGQEDIGAIVEGEDLLWNDHEVKLLDQAVRTMESYAGQFPDVREKVAKRGRKLVDYDSTRHHLESLQMAKKRDDIKILKAEEEMDDAKRVYERINNELKEELPVLHDSRIGCYVTVFSAISSLRDIFYKEMRTLNMDLHNVVKELQGQYPDKVFAVNGIQRYGSLRRRTLMSPRAWKASFSEFHRNYNPKSGPRFSFRSPEKPRHSTLSRESSTIAVSPLSPTLESPTESSRVEMHDLCAQEDAVEVENKPVPEKEDPNREHEEDCLKVEEESEAKSPGQQEEKKQDSPPSESSCELNNSCDSESLELQLTTGDDDLLHVDDSGRSCDSLKAKGQENGDVSGLKSEELDKAASADSKSTEV